MPLGEDVRRLDSIRPIRSEASDQRGYVQRLTRRLANLGVGDYILRPREEAYRWPTLFEQPARVADPFSDDDPLPRAAGSARDLFANPGERIVVVARAGLGKTALLEALAIKVVERGLVPVVLPLASYGHVADQTSILEHVSAFVSSEFGETLQWPHLAENGTLVLLLDGLDEIPSRQRGIVVKRIRQASEDFPGLSWMIALRDQSLTIDISALKYWLLPIEKFDLPAFFRGYLPAALADGLFGALCKSPALLSICRVPLFATLMAGNVIRGGLECIPNGPHRLLSQLVEHMLDPARNRGDTSFSCSVGTLRNKVGLLAYSMLERELVVVDTHTARSFLDVDDADRVLDELVRTGTLNRSGTDIRFALPTVQEFLAASHLVDRDADELVERLAGQVSRPWGQALQFAFVMRSDCGDLIRRVLSVRDDIFGSRVRMCGRIVSWGAQVSPELKMTLGEKLAHLHQALPTALYYLRDEVVTTISFAFSEPLPPSVLDLISSSAFGSGLDDLICCGDDDVLLGALDRTLDRKSIVVFGDAVVTRLRQTGVAGVERIITWIRDGGMEDAKESFKFSIGYLLTDLSHDDETRQCLEDAQSENVFPVEINAAISIQAADTKRSADALVSIVQTPGSPGFYDAQKRLWERQDGEDIWKFLVLDSETGLVERRWLLVRAIDEWRSRGRTLVEEIAVTPEPSLVRSEARAALSIRGDKSAFAMLTDELDSCDIDIILLWCRCLGCQSGGDAIRGGESLLRRELASAEQVQILSNASFQLTHHCTDMDLSGTGSGVERIQPHPIASKFIEMNLDFSSVDGPRALGLLTTLFELGDTRRLEELSEMVRKLWDAWEHGEKLPHEFSHAVCSIGINGLGRGLLEDMVRRGDWNTALAALDALRIEANDLDTVLSLHHSRKIDDGLLMSRLHRAAIELGRDLVFEEKNTDSGDQKE